MQNETCCFTGHRPKTFPWKKNESDPHCIWLKTRILEEVENAVAAGFRRFMAGGAQGVDMWCAEAVIKVKNKYPEKNIKLVLAIPFLKYAGYFSEDEKRRLTKIIDESDERILTSAENDTSSAVAKYYRRNEYMVDNSSRVIAVYEDGKSIKGGTRYTIEYAKKQGCEIILIRWDSEYKKGSVVDFEAR